MNAAHIVEQLARIESMLTSLLEQRTAKDCYSTSEIADMLGRAEFTVREWCRLGRVNAGKRLTGRGNAKEWVIAHEELERIQSEGLLPPPDPFKDLKQDS